VTNMMQRPEKIKKEKKSAMEDTELKVVVNLSVTTDFKKILKTFAADQEMTMSALIVKVLNEYMNNCLNAELNN